MQSNGLGLESTSSVVNLEGNLMISALATKSDKPRYLRLVNKFDYLTNGKSKSGYHTMQDLYHLIKQDERDVVSVSYADALAAFKSTDNAEDFLK